MFTVRVIIKFLTFRSYLVLVCMKVCATALQMSRNPAGSVRARTRPAAQASCAHSTVYEWS